MGNVFNTARLEGAQNTVSSTQCRRQPFKFVYSTLFRQNSACLVRRRVEVPAADCPVNNHVQRLILDYRCLGDPTWTHVDLLARPTSVCEKSLHGDYKRHDICRLALHRTATSRYSSFSYLVPTLF